MITFFAKMWHRPLVVPWLLGGTIFLLIAFTAPHYGLTWDEPAYFHAADLHVQWLAGFFKNLLRGEVRKSLKDEVVKADWRWSPYYVPHPPFSRVLSGVTKALFSSIVDKFVAYRLAPALFFALLVTFMYVWMTALFDRVTGLFSALTLVLTPNLFGFAHFAVTDMPLTVMWFLTVYCFWKGLKDWRWSVALGVVWGLALSTKFPALLIPIPLLLWAHIYCRQSYQNNVFSLVFLSPLVMIASQPYLWHFTFPRILEFLYEGVSRAYRVETNFSIIFFNRFYFTEELPWYYPFFITSVTTPEIILALLLIGVASLPSLKPQREVLVLFLFHALFILVMGLLPGAVLHDGMRQLLPMLPFLGGLAGGGFFSVVRYLLEKSQRIKALQRITYLRAKLIGAVSFLLLFPPALDIFVYHPYELSYYNRLVGGIRGAYQYGLEVTYFMEAFTPDFLKLLNEKLPPNAVINASFSNSLFQFYQREGRLRPDLRITDKRDFDYYILLIRKSSFKKDNWDVINKNPQPYISSLFDGVPLVAIYKAQGRD